ncbi:hypothetical protein [Streptomyces asiaticus]|uniref:hypothetical protein n=1 Tax=Streptomyces asiaticus TaxID=114695 RepID=UPI003821A49F
MTRPRPTSSRPEALPLCEWPRSTLGAPITVGMPCSYADSAAATVVGNSATVPPRVRSSPISLAELGSWPSSRIRPARACSPSQPSASSRTSSRPSRSSISRST